MQRTSMLLVFWMGLWWALQVPDRADIFIMLWIFYLLFYKFQFWIMSLQIDFKCQRTSISFRSWFEFWRMIVVPDCGLESWSWFWYGYWSLMHPWFEFWLFILILKVQVTSTSFKSWFGGFGGCWRFLNLVSHLDHVSDMVTGL